VEKIIARFPSVKLPDELHELILTDKKLISIFIKKLKRKISLKKVLLVFLGGAAFSTQIPPVVAGLEPNISAEKIADIKLNEKSLIFPWQEIDKIYLNNWKNMVKIKIHGKKYKYNLNPDDFQEFKEKLCGK